MKKSIKIIMALLACVIALYFSFYIEPLSEKQQREQLKEFKPEELVDFYWDNKLDELVQQALGPEDLISGLQIDPKACAKKHGQVLGIGSNTFFILNAQAEIIAMDDQTLYLQLNQDIKATIPLMYIFSNLARDASGWFCADDFQNTMDFNTLSSYINKKILQEVIGAAKDQLKVGGHIQFSAAIEVNLNDLPLKEIELVPYQLKVIS